MTRNFGKTLFQRNQNEQEKCPFGSCEHEVGQASDEGFCPVDEYLKHCIARVLVHFWPHCLGCICQVLEHNYIFDFCVDGCDCYLSFENKTETKPYN